MPREPGLAASLRLGRRTAVLSLTVCWALLSALAGCTTETGRRGADPRSEAGIAEAEKTYRQVLARDPADAEAHLGLAELLAERGEVVAADTHFSQAERHRPAWSDRIARVRREHATRYAELALADIEGNRMEEARRRLAAAETLSPGLAETAYASGRVEEARGEAAAAAEHYRRAYRLDPGNDRYREALAPSLIEAGQVAHSEGRYADARDALAEAAELDPSPEIHYLLGSAAFALAERTSRAEREDYLDEAAAAFREVIRARPNDRDASYNLGAVLLSARRFEEAAALYRELIVAEPRDPELYLALSLAHSQLGRVEEGRIEQAIGRALRANHPVEDPEEWARRSAARFAQSDLSRRFLRDGVPQEVQTYQRQEGGLVEVWFYWDRGEVVAFRDGGRIGADFRLPRR